MSTYFLTSLLATLALPGCSGSTRIRVYNDSDQAFSELVVQTPGARHTFGDLPSHAYTDYREFGESYNYAYVSLKINSTDFVLQPIDYVGERPLSTESFTYSVSVVDLNNHTLLIRTTSDEK